MDWISLSQTSPILVVVQSHRWTGYHYHRHHRYQQLYSHTDGQDITIIDNTDTSSCTVTQMDRISLSQTSPILVVVQSHRWTGYHYHRHHRYQQLYSHTDGQDIIIIDITDTSSCTVTQMDWISLSQTSPILVVVQSHRWTGYHYHRHHRYQQLYSHTDGQDITIIDITDTSSCTVTQMDRISLSQTSPILVVVQSHRWTGYHFHRHHRYQQLYSHTDGQDIIIIDITDTSSCTVTQMDWISLSQTSPILVVVQSHRWTGYHYHRHHRYQQLYSHTDGLDITIVDITDTSSCTVTQMDRISLSQTSPILVVVQSHRWTGYHYHRHHRYQQLYSHTERLDITIIDITDTSSCTVTQMDRISLSQTSPILVVVQSHRWTGYHYRRHHRYQQLYSHTDGLDIIIIDITDTSSCTVTQMDWISLSQTSPILVVVQSHRWTGYHYHRHHRYQQLYSHTDGLDIIIIHIIDTSSCTVTQMDWISLSQTSPILVVVQSHRWTGYHYHRHHRYQQLYSHTDGQDITIIDITDTSSCTVTPMDRISLSQTSPILVVVQSHRWTGYHYHRHHRYQQLYSHTDGLDITIIDITDTSSCTVTQMDRISLSQTSPILVVVQSHRWTGYHYHRHHRYQQLYSHTDGQDIIIIDITDTSSCTVTQMDWISLSQTSPIVVVVQSHRWTGYHYHRHHRYQQLYSHTDGLDITIIDITDTSSCTVTQMDRISLSQTSPILVVVQSHRWTGYHYHRHHRYQQLYSHTDGLDITIIDITDTSSCTVTQMDRISLSQTSPILVVIQSHRWTGYHYHRHHRYQQLYSHTDGQDIIIIDITDTSSCTVTQMDRISLSQTSPILVVVQSHRWTGYHYHRHHRYQQLYSHTDGLDITIIDITDTSSCTVTQMDRISLSQTTPILVVVQSHRWTGYHYHRHHRYQQLYSHTDGLDITIIDITDTSSCTVTQMDRISLSQTSPILVVVQSHRWTRYHYHRQHRYQQLYSHTDGQDIIIIDITDTSSCTVTQMDWISLSQTSPILVVVQSHRWTGYHYHRHHRYQQLYSHTDGLDITIIDITDTSSCTVTQMDRISLSQTSPILVVVQSHRWTGYHYHRHHRYQQLYSHTDGQDITIIDITDTSSCTVTQMDWISFSQTSPILVVVQSHRWTGYHYHRHHRYQQLYSHTDGLDITIIDITDTSSCTVTQMDWISLSQTSPILVVVQSHRWTGYHYRRHHRYQQLYSHTDGQDITIIDITDTSSCTVTQMDRISLSQTSPILVVVQSHRETGYHYHRHYRYQQLYSHTDGQDIIIIDITDTSSCTVTQMDWISLSQTSPILVVVQSHRWTGYHYHRHHRYQQLYSHTDGLDIIIIDITDTSSCTVTQMDWISLSQTSPILVVVQSHRWTGYHYHTHHRYQQLYSHTDGLDIIIIDITDTSSCTVTQMDWISLSQTSPILVVVQSHRWTGYHYHTHHRYQQLYSHTDGLDIIIIDITDTSSCTVTQMDWISLSQTSPILVVVQSHRWTGYHYHRHHRYQQLYSHTDGLDIIIIDITDTSSCTVTQMDWISLSYTSPILVVIQSHRWTGYHYHRHHRYQQLYSHTDGQDIIIIDITDTSSCTVTQMDRISLSYTSPILVVVQSHRWTGYHYHRHHRYQQLYSHTDGLDIIIIDITDTSSCTVTQMDWISLSYTSSILVVVQSHRWTGYHYHRHHRYQQLYSHTDGLDIIIIDITDTSSCTVTQMDWISLSQTSPILVVVQSHRWTGYHYHTHHRYQQLYSHTDGQDIIIIDITDTSSCTVTQMDRISLSQTSPILVVVQSHRWTGYHYHRHHRYQQLYSHTDGQDITIIDITDTSSCTVTQMDRISLSQTSPILVVVQSHRWTGYHYHRHHRYQQLYSHTDGQDIIIIDITDTSSCTVTQMDWISLSQTSPILVVVQSHRWTGYHYHRHHRYQQLYSHTDGQDITIIDITDTSSCTVTQMDRISLSQTSPILIVVQSHRWTGYHYHRHHRYQQLYSHTDGLDITIIDITDTSSCTVTQMDWISLSQTSPILVVVQSHRWTGYHYHRHHRYQQLYSHTDGLDIIIKVHINYNVNPCVDLFFK